MLGVPANGPGERDPLRVPADRREVLGTAGVIDPGDFLLDDRPLIEVSGDIVCGCADEFHPVRVCLMVRTCSLEAGEKRMMNIYDPARQLGAQIRREDSHVPG